MLRNAQSQTAAGRARPPFARENRNDHALLSMVDTFGNRGLQTRISPAISPTRQPAAVQMCSDCKGDSEHSRSLPWRGEADRSNQRAYRAADPLSAGHSAGATPASGGMSISRPGDVHEVEAENVAHAVMRMPDSAVRARNDIPVSAATPAPVAQRACASCDGMESKGAHVAALPAGDGAARLQRTESSASAAQPFPSVVENINAMQGGGRPLPNETRAFFEPRFGADFSGVRIHTGARADQTSKSISAKAFTVGSNIAFADGHYAPGSQEGRHLLAHELTHVVQQNTNIRRASKSAPAGSDANPTSRNKANPIIERTAAPSIQTAWYNFNIPFTDYQFDPSLEGVKTAAGVVKDTAVAALDWIVDEIKGLVDSGKDWLKEQWASIQEIAASAFDGVKNAFTSIVGFLKDPLGFLADALMNFDAKSLAGAWATISGFITTVANGFKAMTDGLFQTVGAIWGGINGFATWVLARLSRLTENFLFKKLPDAVQRVAFAAIDVLKSLWNSINDGWTKLLNKIKGWVESALDVVFDFVRKVLSFGFNVVVAGIIEFGQIILFLKDLFSNPMKYVATLAKLSVKAFDGVENRFAGMVGKYFAGDETAQSAGSAPVRIQRAPASGTAAEPKRSASWSEIGHGVWGMMGKKWNEFKSNPLSVITGLLKDMFLPMVGNVKDVVQLFTDIKKIVTGPLSAGSLKELWTSFLQLLDIPILIYHTVVSILMRSLMVPLIVATFIPHPVVKAIAAAVGETLLAAFVDAELLNLAQKLLLLKTGATTGAQKEEAYNRIADSLVALAMAGAIALIELIVNFIVGLARGIYGFIKGRVFGVEPTPLEGGGARTGEGEPKSGKEGRDAPESKADDETLPDSESKKGVAAERTTADGHKIKIMDDGRIFICTTCEELRFKYDSEIKADKELQEGMIDAENTADPQAKADKVESLQKKLADARQKTLEAEPPEVKGQKLADMRARARKTIGEIKARLKVREVIDTLLESPEVKAEIEADLRKLDFEMGRAEEGAKGVEGDPQLEDAARDEFDTVRAQGEALKAKIESELNPPEGSSVPRPELKYPKSMLPSGGDHPYVSPDPSGEVVQATGEKSGYLDKDGNIWQVDRTKARAKKFFEWDVQTKDGGHINVGSDGTVTH